MTREHPDLVFIQWWSTFWAPAFAALSAILHSRGVRTSYLIYHVLPYEDRFWDRWLARIAFRQADAFMMQNKQEIEHLLRLVPRAEIKIAPLPLNDMFAGQKVAIDLARQQLNLPANAKVLLFFGTCSPV